MHTVKVTFPDPIYEMLGREAALAGVGIAQFVREAAQARIVYRKTKRGELEEFADDTGL